jgi:hypothetical protein
VFFFAALINKLRKKCTTMVKECNQFWRLTLFALFSEHGSPAFEEFLDCIGERVALNGFEKYRGGLDCKSKPFNIARCHIDHLNILSVS